MANQHPHAMPQGNMHILQQQQKMHNGSPKTAPKSNKPLKSNITKTTNGARTGDAVSDESDDGDDEGEDGAEDDDQDSDDEPDDFALSGGRRAGNIPVPHLAGLPHKNIASFTEDQAMAGAEDDDEEDEGVYHMLEETEGDDSQSDAAEHSILQAAEQDLISEFTQRPQTANTVTNDLNGMSLMNEEALARRLSLQSQDSQQDDFEWDLDFSADPYIGTQGNSAYNTMWDDAEFQIGNQLGKWRNNEENIVPPTTSQKKVRFEETASSRASSMSSEEDPRDAFPDLFDGQADPALRQQILANSMDIDVINENESVYDFDLMDPYEQAAFDIDQRSDTDSDSSDEDSDGDTTDEETPEEQLARVPQLRASKKSAVPSAADMVVMSKSAPATPATSKRSTPNLSRVSSANDEFQFATPKSIARPKKGTFVHDPTRASITATARGTGVTLVPPTKPTPEMSEYWERARARQAKGSQDGSPRGSISYTRHTPVTASIPQRPLTAKATLGTMFDGNLDFLRNNDEHGIGRQLLKSSKIDSMQSSMTSDTLTDGTGSEKDFNVNLADFVEMEVSDTDEQPPGDMMSPTSAEFFNDGLFDTSSLSRHTNGNELLSHFDQQRGLVSSFRNNQHHARHVSSLAAHPAKRAQASEANALQKGRRAAANTPITPARKSRVSQDLTGAGVKKVASPLIQKQHRRSRGESLSGIQQQIALDSVQK